MLLYLGKPLDILYVGDSPVVPAVASLSQQAAAGNVQLWVTAGLPASMAVMKVAAQGKPRSREASSKAAVRNTAKGLLLVFLFSGVLCGVKDRGGKSQGGL